jgi:phosphatidylglycerophosphate synthase
MEQLFNKAYRSLNGFFEIRIARWTPEFISPNMITVSRVFFIAPIIIFLFCEMNLPAIILFLFAALLDYADGALARGRGSQTELGEFLDPISDKIFFCAISMTTSIALFAHNEFSIATSCLLALVICSVNIELFIAFVRVLDFFNNQNPFSRTKRKNLKADWSGKMKFIIQMTGAGLMLLIYPDWISGPAIWIAIACLALSLPLAAISLAHKLQGE